MTCSFIGHQSGGLGLSGTYDDERFLLLRAMLGRVVRKLVGLGCDTFCTGMVDGFDLMAAEQLLDYKYTNCTAAVRLCAFLPFPQRERGLDEGVDASLYGAVLGLADEVLCVSERYTPNCDLRRNRCLVERADIIFAAYNPAYFQSSTGRTIRLAQKRGIPVLNLNPVTFELSFLLSAPCTF